MALHSARTPATRCLLAVSAIALCCSLPVRAQRPAGSVTTSAPVEPVQAALDDVMDRVAAYVGEYQSQLAGVVAEERYHQSVMGMSGPLRGRIGNAGSERDLRSDLLLVRPAGEEQWVQFRDVFEVDGRALRDRDERLYKLFVEPMPGSRRQAEVIQEEGARYNIGPLTRTLNVPILALTFLSEGTQSSFEYRRVKAGDLSSFRGVALAGDIWVIEYRETARDTLIRGANNRSLPSRGKLWIEAATGRVLGTELLSEDVQVKAEIVVDYRMQPGVDLLVPVEMREHYTLAQLYMRIEGRATYNRFRRFTVTTSEKPKPE